MHYLSITRVNFTGSSDLCKYVFCPICFIVLIAGAISGGIG